MIQKSEIEAMEFRLVDGIKDNNLIFLNRVMHDDLMGIAPDGQLITKEKDMASHRSGTMKVETIDAKIEDISIIGDNAIVNVIYETKGKMFGNPVEGKFRYLRVWKKTGTQLQIIAVSCFQC